MIVRFILTVLFFFLAYTVLNAVLRILMSNVPTQNNDDEVDQMVQCEYCSTYVPKNEAVRKKLHGKICYFCDAKCLKEYKKQGGKEA
ncbi:MAG: hypothetical protein B6I36_10490 [Desulfobacteraceae bacterium 4572_35.1]|nr:MAG: hypothetical protein B6I36_10490 [Desulfobacteraceae bacterium 4572_35.1]